MELAEPVELAEPAQPERAQPERARPESAGPEGAEREGAERAEPEPAAPGPEGTEPAERAGPAARAEPARPAARAGTRIAAVRAVLPPYRYPQHELAELAAELCLPPGADPEPVRRLHKAAGVGARHLALPIERYRTLGDFTEANDAWIEAAGDLGARAISEALADAGVAPDEVDVLACASVTGLAVPSLDARLAVRLGMRPDVRRLPLFGLGCVAGAAGLARLHDQVAGTGGVGVLLTVELCSLTVQRGDDSMANLVAGALFGDGAAAVVLRGGGGPDVPGPAVVATGSVLFPGTGHVMGWDIGTTGFRVVLSADLPDLVRARLRPAADAFLARHGLTVRDIDFWVCHPGGPRVLEAVGESLDLPPGALDVTWRSLAEVGNLSSASVLHVLAGTLADAPPPPGSRGLLLAMGPGFCAEFVLLRG